MSFKSILNNPRRSVHNYFLNIIAKKNPIVRSGKKKVRSGAPHHTAEENAERSSAFFSSTYSIYYIYGIIVYYKSTTILKYYIYTGIEV